MKILHLIDSGGLYGAEKVILNLSQGLERLQHRSLIGCLTCQGSDKPAIGAAAEALGLETVYFVQKYKYDLSCTAEIATFCQRVGIEIVHAHGYKAAFVSLLLRLFYRTSYLVTCHLCYAKNLRMRFYSSIEILGMMFASSVVGVSEKIVDDLASKRVPRRKLHLVDNGIDLQAYAGDGQSSAVAYRKELGLRDDSFVVGSLGRLAEQKDYKTFIRAAAHVLKKMKNVEFIVAGDGPLFGECEALTKALGIENNFHFLGFRNDAARLLGLMDIFVLSSLDEGLPMAMLEAMAARRPVVTTAVGGIPKVIVDGSNGLLFPTGDYLQLAEKLLLLIENPERKECLGSAAYTTIARDFSLEAMTAKYLEIYTAILA